METKMTLNIQYSDEWYRLTPSLPSSIDGL